MADDPKPVTGDWVEWDDVPEPDPVTLEVHPIRSGDVETVEEPGGDDPLGVEDRRPV